MDFQDYKDDELEEDCEELPLGLWGSGFSHFDINHTSRDTGEESQAIASEVVPKPSSDDIDSLLDSYYPKEPETEDCIGLWSYHVPLKQKDINEYENSAAAVPTSLEMAETSEDEYDEDSLPLWFTPKFDISNHEHRTGFKEININEVSTEYEKEEEDFVGTKKYFERVQTTPHK